MARFDVEVDQQRSGLGDARQVAGEGDGRAEFPQRPGPRERPAGGEGGGDRRQGHPPEPVAGAGAQGGGRFFRALIH